MRFLYLSSAFIMMLLLIACGEKRRFGDLDGTPVRIDVELDRAFVTSMENRQARPSAGAGVGIGSGGFSGVGVGVGLSFSSTHVYLVGGDNIGQANIFRREINWGINSFTVPLTPQRTLHLSVQVEGGRRGWEAIGPVVISLENPVISLKLSNEGALILLPEQTKIAPPPTP
jgi:hypothetical protein